MNRLRACTSMAAAILLSTSTGCAEPASRPELEADRGHLVELPHANGEASTPWGGDDPARWGAEAILANAASEALNEGWAREDVVDVVVAVPVKLRGSDFHPFGDGQSNASVDFPYWEHAAPPVVGLRLVVDDPAAGEHVEALVRFHPGVSDYVPSGRFELYAWSGGWGPPRIADGVLDAGGYTVALHEHLTEQQLDGPLFVRPVGWNDGFPLRFAIPHATTDALLAAMPPAHRTLSPGIPTLDPADLGHPAEGTVFDALVDAVLPAGFNEQPYVSHDVHGAIPFEGTFVATATGRAWTWLVEPSDAPQHNVYKDIYICFEGRNLEQEAQLGVPSGSGWHRIGDPAESLVNDLEDVALPVSFVDGSDPLPAAAGGHAYLLDRVATYRFLHPGESFTVAAPDFHGYLVPHEQEVCTQILVHPDPVF